MTPRPDIAEAIMNLAAYNFEAGAEMMVDGDPMPYDIVRTGPQTLLIDADNRRFEVHVRSRR